MKKILYTILLTTTFTVAFAQTQTQCGCECNKKLTKCWNDSITVTKVGIYNDYEMFEIIQKGYAKQKVIGYANTKHAFCVYLRTLISFYKKD